MSLPTHQLEALLAVAEEESISRAADRLFISQPALSKQIQELERTVGQPLFDRLPRGMRLTESGRLLLGYARRMHALQEEAERALAEAAGLARGRLAIGASTTIGIYLLPEILGRYHARYPGIELALEIGNTEQIQHKLIEGTVDVGMTEGYVQSVELTAEVFFTDEMVAIAPPGHPLARREGVPAGQLCAEPMLLREPGSGTRAVVEHALAGCGAAPQPAMSLGSTEAIKRAVAAGIGVSIVSRLTLDQELANGRLCIVPLIDLTILRPLHLLQLHGRHPSTAVRAFLEHLAQALPVARHGATTID